MNPSEVHNYSHLKTFSHLEFAHGQIALNITHYIEQCLKMFEEK